MLRIRPILLGLQFLQLAKQLIDRRLRLLVIHHLYASITPRQQRIVKCSQADRPLKEKNRAVPAAEAGMLTCVRITKVFGMHFEFRCIPVLAAEGVPVVESRSIWLATVLAYSEIESARKSILRPQTFPLSAKNTCAAIRPARFV